jgi:excisionase family DNA binding protein
MTDLIDKALVSEIVAEVAKMPLNEVKAELEFMEADEVAKKLGMGLSTVYARAKDGRLPGVWYGPRIVRFRARALLALHIYKERLPGFSTAAA